MTFNNTKLLKSLDKRTKELGLFATKKTSDTSVPTIFKEDGEKSEVNSLATDFRIRGMIRKEKIPVELELGDYWYWMYFNEPFLLENSASGIPQYINKIQVVEAAQNFFTLENFLDKQVEVAGNIGWGYAESNVFNIVAIVILK